MAGIEKTLEVFDDLTVLTIAGISVAKEFKHGVGISAILGSINKILAIGKSVEELIKDLPGALPELLDLDGQESSQIGVAAYTLVKKVVESI